MGEKPAGGDKRAAAAEVGPRQRRDTRVPFQARLEARCSTWDNFHQLFTHNVSRTGLFIATSVPTAVGDKVEVTLHVPASAPIRLTGEVRHVFTKGAVQQGLGVQLKDVCDEDLLRYRNLVDLARTMAQVKARDEAIETAHDSPVPGQQRSLLDSSDAALPQQPLPGTSPPPAPPARPQPDSPPAAPASPRADKPPAAPASPRADKPPAAPASARPPPPPADAIGPPRAPGAKPAAPAIRRPSMVTVAFDFGTSRSSASAVIDREVHVLKLADGSWDMPSVIGFQPDGRAVVGSRAREMLGTDPSNALGSPKRMLGRLHDDPELQPYLPQLAMTVRRGRGGQLLVQARGKTYTIEQVCAPIIFALRRAAEARLKQPIQDVVMTAPVSFGSERYAALTEAAKLAGLRVVDFIDEPTAAALSHKFDKSFNDVVAVYDFGGGTFDFTVVDVSSSDIQVLATVGDSWLGGDDFDEALAGAVADAFWRQHKMELRHQVVQWQRLLVAAEAAKRALSSRDTAVIELEEVALTRQGPLGLRYAVSRADFARLTADIIARSIDTCAQALDLSGIKPTELNAVYLSGGTSYIPAVRDAVARYFGKPGRAAVPPERAVVIGAAVYGVMREGSKISL